MKGPSLILLASLLFSPSIFAQGTVAFVNPSTALLTTNANGNVGSISPIGAYRIGLYAGPLGSQTLSLVGLATNSPLPGRFNGGNPFTLPTAPGLYDGSVAISFQIRAWSFAAGNSYEEALDNATCAANTFFIGTSITGTVIPNAPGSVSPTPTLFGTNPGNVSGFVLYQTFGSLTCPEPSTYALGALGALLATLVSRKHSRRK